MLENVEEKGRAAVVQTEGTFWEQAPGMACSSPVQ